MAAYCDGDTRAQFVWHDSCSLLQLLRQDSLAVVLPVVDVPDEALGGTTHDVWQLAACELHVIMQLVVVEVWARRSKVPPLAALAAATPASVTAIPRPRTAVSFLRTNKPSIGAGEAEDKCAFARPGAAASGGGRARPQRAF